MCPLARQTKRRGVDYVEDGKGDDEKIFLRGKRSENPALTRRCQNLPQMSSN